MNKQQQRRRRACRTRHAIRRLKENRLTVHRTGQHIYAQIIDPTGSRVLASASTIDKEVRGSIKSGSNIDAATEVGKLVAKRAVAAGVKKVAFDRSGLKYHGRIKALADAAREGGVQF